MTEPRWRKARFCGLRETAMSRRNRSVGVRNVRRRDWYSSFKWTERTVLSTQVIEKTVEIFHSAVQKAFWEGRGLLFVSSRNMTLSRSDLRKPLFVRCGILKCRICKWSLSNHHLEWIPVKGRQVCHYFSSWSYLSSDEDAIENFQWPPKIDSKRCEREKEFWKTIVCFRIYWKSSK
jgi:hypothetical protein